MGSGRVDPHRIRRAYQAGYLLSPPEQIDRYAAFTSLTWCFTTSLRLAVNPFSLALVVPLVPPWVLAGLIPTELGKLINMTRLFLSGNSLTGMYSANFNWCGSIC